MDDKTIEQKDNPGSSQTDQSSTSLDTLASVCISQTDNSMSPFAFAKEKNELLTKVGLLPIALSTRRSAAFENNNENRDFTQENSSTSPSNHENETSLKCFSKLMSDSESDIISSGESTKLNTNVPGNIVRKSKRRIKPPKKYIQYSENDTPTRSPKITSSGRDKKVAQTNTTGNKSDDADNTEGGGDTAKCADDTYLNEPKNVDVGAKDAHTTIAVEFVDLEAQRPENNGLQSVETDTSDDVSDRTQNIDEEVERNINEDTDTKEKTRKGSTSSDCNSPESEYSEIQCELIEISEHQTLSQDSEDGSNEADYSPSKRKRRRKRFTCRVCKKLYKTKSAWYKHKVTEHIKPEDTGPFICTQCKKEFKKPSTLKTHIRNIHEQPRKSLACDDCDYENKFEREFYSHRWTAHGIDPPKNFEKCTCSVCGYKTLNKNYMLIHKRRHAGEKPYVCPICKADFCSSGELSFHLRWHDDERKIKCNVSDCKYSTVDLRRLNYHQQIVHFNRTTRPFACDRCEYCTNIKGNLVLHRQRKHDIDPDVKMLLSGIKRGGKRFKSGSKAKIIPELSEEPNEESDITQTYQIKIIRNSVKGTQSDEDTDDDCDEVVDIIVNADDVNETKPKKKRKKQNNGKNKGQNNAKDPTDGSGDNENNENGSLGSRASSCCTRCCRPSHGAVDPYLHGYPYSGVPDLHPGQPHYSTGFPRYPAANYPSNVNTPVDTFQGRYIIPGQGHTNGFEMNHTHMYRGNSYAPGLGNLNAEQSSTRVISNSPLFRQGVETVYANKNFSQYNDCRFQTSRKGNAPINEMFPSRSQYPRGMYQFPQNIHHPYRSQTNMALTTTGNDTGVNSQTMSSQSTNIRYIVPDAQNQRTIVQPNVQYNGQIQNLGGYQYKSPPTIDVKYVRMPQNVAWIQVPPRNNPTVATTQNAPDINSSSQKNSNSQTNVPNTVLEEHPELRAAINAATISKDTVYQKSNNGNDQNFMKETHKQQQHSTDEDKLQDVTNDVKIDDEANGVKLKDDPVADQKFHDDPNSVSDMQFTQNTYIVNDDNTVIISEASDLYEPETQTVTLPEPVHFEQT